MAKARTLTLKTAVEVTGADKLNNLGQKFQKTGAILSAAVTAPLVGLGAALINMSEEAARADAELQRTFESMGAGAWTTVDALKAQQQELQGLTTFADEDISHLQSVLMTFGQVTGDSFDRAVEAGLDMSALLGQDLQASATQLGKALNDPIRGVTALRRVGVSFNEQQIEQIRLMTEAGDVAAAQGVILDEVERQFGGAAEAIADTASGQMTQALNELGDAGEEFGEVMAPLLKDLAGFVKDLAGWLKDLNPETKEWAVRIGAVLAVAGPLLVTVGTLMRTLSGIPTIISGANRAFGTMKTTIGAGPLGLIGAVIALGLALHEVGKELTASESAFSRDFQTRLEGLGTSSKEAEMAVMDLAEELGISTDEAASRIEEFADRTGRSFDDAVLAVQRGAKAMTDEQWDAVEESGNAWATFQNQLSDAMYGTGGAVPTVTDAADEMAGDLGEIPEKGADELLANQFHLTDAVDELLRFMEEALDPAQEIFNARMFLASQAAADGLASGNPLVVKKTEEMIAEAQAVIDAAGPSWFDGGYNSIIDFAGGIYAGSQSNIFKNHVRLAADAARGIFPSSEPKDPTSPFRGITKAFGFMDTFAKGLSSTSGVVSRTLANTFSAPQIPAIGAGGGGVMPISPAGGTTINLYFQGDLTNDRGASVANSVLRAWQTAAGTAG